MGEAASRAGMGPQQRAPTQTLWTWRQAPSWVSGTWQRAPRKRGGDSEELPRGLGAAVSSTRVLGERMDDGVVCVQTGEGEEDKVGRVESTADTWGP